MAGLARWSCQGLIGTEDRWHLGQLYSDNVTLLQRALSSEHNMPLEGSEAHSWCLWAQFGDLISGQGWEV